MKRGRWWGLLLLALGLIPLTNVAQSPGFDAIRKVDVLRLIGSGMCFGVGIFALLTGLKERQNSAAK